MPVISQLNLYPIKSCAGLSLKEATLTEAGLATQLIYDREWMVIDDNNVALTQRTHPRMALIQPKIKGDHLEIRAPGMLALEIPLDLPDPALTPRLTVTVWENPILAFDLGPLCATWFSKFLDTPVRFVRFHSEAQRFAKEKWTGDVKAPTLFADGYPLLVLSQASHDDLNQKMRAAGREAIPIERFRANIILSDCNAHDEDYAEDLVSGEIRIKPVKPCSRCDLPAVCQRTGEVGPNPLDILQTYRADERIEGAISFGMNAIVLGGDGQTLRVGQELTLNLAF
jgi:uncharacterized protein YcbX